MPMRAVGSNRSGAAGQDRGEDADEAEGHADCQPENPLTKLPEVLMDAIELAVDSLEPGPRRFG
jgi:hypothetical protein